jgi:hypothetical protein
MDRWLLGRVLILLREKLKAERKWLAWVKEHLGLKRSSAYEAIEIHNQLSLEEVQHLPLTKAYKLADAARAEQRPKKTNSPKKGKTNYPWAVEEEEYEIVHDFKQAADAGDEFLKLVRSINLDQLTAKQHRDWETKFRATIEALDDELGRLIRLMRMEKKAGVESCACTPRAIADSSLTQDPTSGHPDQPSLTA